jgi:hypothetical protein
MKRNREVACIAGVSHLPNNICPSIDHTSQNPTNLGVEWNIHCDSFVSFSLPSQTQTETETSIEFGIANSLEEMSSMIHWLIEVPPRAV